MATTKRLRLTQTVNRGGCAAKLPAGTLTNLLAGLPAQEHPDLLIGSDLLDDAAAWRLSDGRVMVQTVDFFTPMIDDPFDFGAVAAANALSDIFAMGAVPATALTVLAWPGSALPESALSELMSGAAERINAAGALLVGGHSIDDDTLKLGFSVTGFADEADLWSNREARPGDRLILTKALGTGTLTSGRKNDELSEADVQEAIESMKQLNRLDLPERLHRQVHAATDVTGFGLLGHALHLAHGSGVGIALDPAAVPLLANAREALQRGIINRAHGSNSRYVEAHVNGRERLDEAQWLALVDPQTSGGLLLSVDPAAADEVLAVVSANFPRAAMVGEVRPAAQFAIELV